MPNPRKRSPYDFFFDAAGDVLTFVTLAIGTLGGLVLFLLNVPAPWLVGPAVAVAAFAMLRGRTHISSGVDQVMQIALGIVVGSGVSPETLALMHQWPVSLIGQMIVMVVAVVASALFLRHVGGWDRSTAVLASIPGVLPYVVALATERSADVRAVAFAQALRVLFVVGMLPLMPHAGQPAAMTLAEPIAYGSLAVLAIAGSAGGLVFMLLRVPGGLLLGALAASGLCYGTGFVSGALPDWLVLPAMIVLGAWVGSRFEGTAPETLWRILLLSVGALTVTFALTAAGAAVIAWQTGFSFVQVFLGFVPGGVEITALLALIFGVDPTFVAAHQLARFIVLSVCLPLVLGSAKPVAG